MSDIRRPRARRTFKQSWRGDRDIDRDDTAAPRPVMVDPADWGHTPESARAELQRQMCPVCGEGPWKSPLNHAARKHGFDRFTMRDICGLTTDESVVDDALHEKFANRSLTPEQAVAMVEAREAKNRPRRLTAAGREHLQANLDIVNNDPVKKKAAWDAAMRAITPESRRKQGESLRANWAARRAQG